MQTNVRRGGGRWAGGGGPNDYTAWLTRSIASLSSGNLPSAFFENTKVPSTVTSKTPPPLFVNVTSSTPSTAFLSASAKLAAWFS